MMKIITTISRIIVGLVFTFSGFVKGVDPLGSAYKFSDYFSAFGLGFLDPLALPLAIALCTIEFMAGMMMISGSCINFSSWIVTIFMILFTPLTFFLALFNPVSDCGCFGDAIHLTNWQTFSKNIIISLLVIIVFIKRKDKTTTLKKSRGIVLTSVNLLIFLVFVIINILCLPVIDFRPYKPGTNLQASMSTPAGAPADKYDIRFLYTRDGIEKEFTLADYPANDTTWKFVDQKSVLISKGYTPPIHDFSLVTTEGADITEEVITSGGYTLLMVTKKIEEASLWSLVKGIKTGDSARQNKMTFHILTSSSKDNAEALTMEHSVLFCDETTLKTVIRSNPGFVLIKEGSVAAMWSFRCLPEPNCFSDPEKLISDFANKNFVREIITFSIFTLLLIISIFALFTVRK